MLDIAQWKNSNNDPQNTTGEEHIRDAWGFVPAVEYYPWSNLNIKFFANWVGRFINTLIMQKIGLVQLTIPPADLPLDLFHRWAFYSEGV